MASVEEVLKIDKDSTSLTIFQSLMDSQKNLIVLLYKNEPLLFNSSFLKFCGVSTVKEFNREFGSLLNRFVPHDNYFHAGKVADFDSWITELLDIPEQDRIVSMINTRAEPYAFSITISTPLPDYTILSFTDISQDLIKRIMIENDVSIDKESGAYDKDYFIHTSKSFHEAAEFNEKKIGITLIELMCSDIDAATYLHDFTSSIKSNIRQSDMLVRWGKTIFLLAYLVDTPENSMKFSRKLFTVMREEPFDKLKTVSMRIGTTIQGPKEDINEVIQRSERALRESEASKVSFL